MPGGRVRRPTARRSGERVRAGGGIARQIVVAVLVPGDAAGEPPAKAPAARRLPALHDAGRHPAHVGAPGKNAGRHLGHRDVPWCGHRIAYALLGPAPEVRREHRVVVAARRGDGSGRQRGHHRVVHRQGAADPLKCRAQPPFAPRGVPADAAREVHPLGPYRRREGADLLHDIPGTHHEVPAAGPQPGIQVGQTVSQERPAVRGVEPGRPHPVVVHEQRDDLIGPARGGRQHRVVVQPQIGREQGYRHRHSLDSSGCTSFSRAGRHRPVRSSWTVAAATVSRARVWRGTTPIADSAIRLATVCDCLGSAPGDTRRDERVSGPRGRRMRAQVAGALLLAMPNRPAGRAVEREE